ncbi:MAG: FMN-dependent NADH-azoreductase [Thermodesulfobacteriota bacterium]
MAKLLHIDASPRGVRSHSRRLTKEFIDICMGARSEDTVIYRDIGHNPPPHVDEAWIAAAFASPDKRTQKMQETLKISNDLIDELLASDILIIGLPMYNFSVPSTFKAYIDQIVRIGRTFDFDPDDQSQPYKPLVHGKRSFIIVSTGDSGYESGGNLSELNHLDPYMRTIFGFIGITDLTFVHVGNDEFGGEKLANSLINARAKIAELTSTLANRIKP